MHRIEALKALSWCVVVSLSRPRLPAVYHDQVYMNRIATFTDPDASKYVVAHLNSEWVLGHHLKVHNISVSVRNMIPTN